MAPTQATGDGSPGSFGGLTQRLLDYVFGYDFFVSYAHADGEQYPFALREQLERAGFRVFLDESETGFKAVLG